MKKHAPFWFGAALCGVAAALFLGSALTGQPDARAASSQDISKRPAPVAQAKAGQSTATFAGGCFWSMEAMFSKLKGVSSAQPGYAGGKTKNPTYEQVGQGETGYAETINVIYNPKEISYGELLKVFLTIHDPTQLDRQGNDVGTNYRSEIFYRNDEQKKLAEQALAQPASAYGWDGKIVTKLAPLQKFYRAEDYHLNYYNLHPTNDYCQAVVAPKLAKFNKEFKAQLK